MQTLGLKPPRPERSFGLCGAEGRPSGGVFRLNDPENLMAKPRARTVKRGENSMNTTIARAMLGAVGLMAAGIGAASAITVAPRVAAMESLVAESFGTFDIVLDYGSETPDPAYAAAFTAAELFWESQIAGYRQPTTASAAAVSPLAISVTLHEIDGAGNILGGAATTTYWNDTIYKTASSGVMEFDTADLAIISEQRLEFLILHEMAHVLGLNSAIWSLNGVVDGFVDVADPGTDYFTQYVGEDGLAAYNIENGSSEAFILLEDEGAAGTRGAHWNEETFLGTFSDQGNPELMTGWLGASAYLSQTTLFALQDVGFALASAEVPVPAAGGLLIAGLFGLVAAGRRRRAVAG